MPGGGGMKDIKNRLSIDNRRIPLPYPLSGNVRINT